MPKRLGIVAVMKLFIFLACAKDGTASFVDVLAETPADAVRALVAMHPGKRFNIVNITTP